MGQLQVLYTHSDGTADAPRLREYRGIGPHGSNVRRVVWSPGTSILRMGKFSKASGESRESFSMVPDFD